MPTRAPPWRWVVVATILLGACGGAASAQPTKDECASFAAHAAKLEVTGEVDYTPMTKFASSESEDFAKHCPELLTKAQIKCALAATALAAFDACADRRDLNKRIKTAQRPAGTPDPGQPPAAGASPDTAADDARSAEAALLKELDALQAEQDRLNKEFEAVMADLQKADETTRKDIENRITDLKNRRLLLMERISKAKGDASSKATPARPGVKLCPPGQPIC